jgi:hypothetical protein
MVEQSGDQLIVGRIAPNPGRMQLDCEDAALDCVLNFMHFVEWGKSAWSRYAGQYWAPTLACCSLLVDSSLPLSERESYLFSGAHPSKQHAGVATAYEAHVTAIAFPIQLLEALVRKARKREINGGKLQQKDLILMEGTDWYPGYMGSGMSVAQHKHNRLVERFHQWCESLPLRTEMWQIPEPESRTGKARLYGYSTTIYSSLEVDGQMVGQVFWYNAQTREMGIPMRDLFQQSNDWVLEHWELNPVVEFDVNQATSYVLEEPRSICYTKGKEEKSEKTNTSEKTIWMYCRKVD